MISIGPSVAFRGQSPFCSIAISPQAFSSDEARYPRVTAHSSLHGACSAFELNRLELALFVMDGKDLDIRAHYFLPVEPTPIFRTWIGDERNCPFDAGGSSN